MPTYEYVCKSCGHLFEIVQSMRDDPLTECPECGGELRKVFAPPAISFKGSGFYATDHGKKSSKPAGDKGEKSGEGEKKSDPGSGEKKDSKSGASGDGSKKESTPSASSSASSKASSKEGGSGS
ncbi:MAG: FmdB family transcriptional regulator [Actinomycetota bacterium]|nr:FmdB family transcriptional regulator [Actinomycetota bacterium]MDH5224737.1 FmdB family transcriptional regulator [Actinomycetota bacterium]